jgi:serine/threonine protein kinase
MNIDLVKELGRGTYGTVTIAIDKNNNNHRVAIKAMKNLAMNNDISIETLKEIVNIYNLQHPNILSVDPLIYSTGAKRIFYVDNDENSVELSLELMDGDLYSLTKDVLDKQLARKFVSDVTNGLYFMHLSGYIHNDLKNNNILYKIVDGVYTFKISDFGLSQYMGIPFPSSVLNFLGTPTFKAPNSIRKGNRYNYNSDMFSLGATMYWLCLDVNRVPPESYDIDTSKKEFTSKKGMLVEMYGKDGYSFLLECLNLDSKKRMSSKTALEHPYISSLQNGGAYNSIYYKVNQLYKQPDYSDIKKKTYEFEYLEDMMEYYKDIRVNLYNDYSNHPEEYKLNEFNNWAFSVFNNQIEMKSFETFFQYLILFNTVLNTPTIIIDKDNIELTAATVLEICHKLYSISNFNQEYILDAFVAATDDKYTVDEFNTREKYILNKLDCRIPLIPVMFYLNYWYLGCIYLHKNKTPNIQVLSTSIATMIVILSSYSSLLQDVSINDVAKYCVYTGVMIQKYSKNANTDILSIDVDLKNTLDSIVDKFIDTDQSTLQLYENIKNILTGKQSQF